MGALVVLAPAVGQRADTLRLLHAKPSLVQLVQLLASFTTPGVPAGARALDAACGPTGPIR